MASLSRIQSVASPKVVLIVAPWHRLDRVCRASEANFHYVLLAHSLPFRPARQLTRPVESRPQQLYQNQGIRTGSYCRTHGPIPRKMVDKWFKARHIATSPHILTLVTALCGRNLTRVQHTLPRYFCAPELKPSIDEQVARHVGESQRIRLGRNQEWIYLTYVLRGGSEAHLSNHSTTVFVARTHWRRINLTPIVLILWQAQPCCQYSDNTYVNRRESGRVN